MEPTTFFTSKCNRMIGAATLVTLAVALVSYAVYTFAQAKYMENGYQGPVTITVTGEGEVATKPDIGSFNFSVVASAQDGAAAQTEVNNIEAKIIKYLQEKGVEEKDIKTSDANLYPKYRYEEQRCLNQLGYCPGNQVPDGFEATQSVTVKLRNLDSAGEILAGVAEREATNISGLQFTIDDPSGFEAEARSLAIADAKAKAKVLAKDLGSRLGKMVSYSEGGAYPVPYYGYAEDSMMKAEAVSVPAAVLPTGENTIKSTVNITYQLK